MLKRAAFVLITLAVLSLGLLPSGATAQTPPPEASSLLVKLVSGLSANEQAAVIARNGGTETSAIPALRLHVVQVLIVELANTLARYEADPQVQHVEENRVRRSEMLSNDEHAVSQWALPQIGWDLAFGAVVPTGTTKVAILDSGIDAAHPDLAGRVVPGTSILDGSNGMSDSNGHGTWLAGIVAANTDNTIGVAGVAFAGVQLVPVTVLDGNGEGRDSDVIAGVIWAADHGADVILMAFSNPGFSPNLQDAIDYAWSRGAVLVAATGNDGVGTPTFPAGDRGVIGVSGTDPDDALLGYSNYGKAAFLAAPGESIATTDLNDEYVAVSGTSSSAAIVAGVAAFLKAVDPSLTNGIIVGRMARTADPAGTQEQTGNGRVNLARALTDTGTDELQPAGADPVGDGGPFVGPYVAASVTSVTITSPTNASPVTITSLPGSVTVSFSYVTSATGTTTGTADILGTSLSATKSLSSGSGTDSIIVTIPAGTANGTYNLKVTVSNNDGSGSNNKNDNKNGAVVINVPTKTTPTITWANPAGITYPTALSGTQLNATASVPGAFTYTPAAGMVLNAGNGQALHVDFVPTDTANYNGASKDVSINVQKGTPDITWANPADITYPTALSGTQLNATASVPGVITYTRTAGTVLNAGNGQTLHVDFVPTDTANYNNASKDVSINVLKGTPVITWANPADITYPTALSATQLNAAANVAGTFVYSPASGATLGAGANQTLHVEFTPNDTTNYNGASKDVSITVQKGTPVITWANPADITYPTALSATQLNATANVAGTFVYSPASGATLGAGANQTLHVEFTPNDTANYNGASKDVSITVQKGTPVITWANPADITYPTALSATQLNAAANVAGTFVYSPASGATLGAGANQTLHVEFTPNDTTNYNGASKDVSITVQKATPVITWANPAPVFYGTALSATQLNATADVPGNFVYTPPATTVVPVGSAQTLKVDFTPTDTANYNNVSKTVYINVLAWTMGGFFQPVDMDKVNTVKGGSTVPLKFRVYAGTTELTSTSVVSQFLQVTTGCASGTATDDIEEYATGGTVLRYDTQGGQFIFNWQTPKGAGKCYDVILKTQDGSSITAHFKTK